MWNTCTIDVSNIEKYKISRLASNNVLSMQKMVQQTQHNSSNAKQMITAKLIPENTELMGMWLNKIAPNWWEYMR